ncbi:MAG: alpha/beta hydrolase [Nitriliruptorales bacterium]|nr:alpha/beta hydrolase [Nitriliruptorales bacterium]
MTHTDTLSDWGELDPRWSGIHDEWIEVSGHPVHVLRADGPSDGTPLLLVHGLGGSATNWVEVMARLSERGPVVAPDLPGFGRTEPPRIGAARVQNNARFVWSLARELGWDRVELHGNSMGGLLSALVAADAPELVDRLFLVAPGLPAPVAAVHRIPRMALVTFAAFVVPGLGQRVLRRRYRRLDAEQLYEMTLDLVHHDPTRVRPAVREIALANVEFGREADWRLPAFVAAAESLVALHVGRRRVHAAIDAITCPTTVVWGEHDQLVGRHVIDHLRERRPDWRFEILDDCGHVPMIEWPDRYLDLVVSEPSLEVPAPASA